METAPSRYAFELPMPAGLDAPPEGHLAGVEGIELYFEVHGRGEPLVLLHGFHACGRVWRPFVPDLAQHYQVIVPDLRGHGRSTDSGAQFTHRQAARDIYALLDRMGIERFRAIGASSGGMTLLHMATQQPARPVGLVLIYATTWFGPAAREIMRQSTPEKLGDEELADMRMICRRGGEAQARSLREQFHRFKDDYDDMNFTGPLLSTIAAPTLIVHGDRDAFFPVEIPFEMYRWIPTSYLWVVPNWGHGPMEPHRPAITQAALAMFRGEWQA